ncbi:MAG: helix-turn-helix transcriptional regulator [Burkholderiales bacterium]|nr:helix-turn-helix transcriptional regulator [Burkholderiales bacterium]
MIVPPPDALRDWRHGRGLSAREAGALVHVTARTWLRWEAGDVAMPLMAWDLAQRRVAETPRDPDARRPT